MLPPEYYINGGFRLEKTGRDMYKITVHGNGKRQLFKLHFNRDVIDKIKDEMRYADQI